MQRTLFALVSIALISSAGCCNEASGLTEEPSGDPTKPSPAKPAVAAVSKKVTDVDLAPLPLTVQVPTGGAGAMDMSIGDHKSVTVDIGDGASLNIREMKEKNLAALKETYQKDTILHPFKRFAKEGADRFVVEFESDGKTGYVGVTVRELGGKSYVCKTTGLAGVKSAKLAETQLEVCGRLKAK